MKSLHDTHFESVDTVSSRLSDVDYIASRQLATAVYLAFNLEKPVLVEGPAGVGKTELAKALADALYGSRDALVQLDMSECAEATGVARLVGAAPGYVGYGEGGQLTDAVRRRPACVVVLDT